MSSPNHSETSITLLSSVQGMPGDEQAWKRFVDRYEPLIHKWCTSWGLQESDRMDVTQEVLLRLSRAMQDFQYDSSSSFRAWLKTVTRRAWIDWTGKQRKPGRGRGDSEIIEVLQSIEARQDFSRRLEEEYDAELMDLAILRVQMAVTPRTWQAFQLTAMDGLPGKDVAEQLDMNVAHVYVARSEVKQALQKEIQRLESSVMNT